MKTRALLSLLLAILFLPANSFARETWTQVRSKNFLLVGNAHDKEIRGVGTKLEQFRETFRQLFPKANFSSAKPTVVVVFNSHESYNPFKPVRANGRTATNVAGYFQPGLDVNYITLSTASDERETYGIIFHEYVHFFLNNNFGCANIPPWFNEGLAEYYQTFKLENDQRVILGELQAGHLQFLQQQELIPFDKFLNTNYFSLRNQGNHGTSIFYAQSWALLHYLQQGNKGARRAQLTEFLNLLINNKPPRDAFETAFQTDYATMEKELRKYIEQRSFSATAVTFKDKLTFDVGMHSAPLSEADANAYLGDLLLHANRFEEAKVRLNQAIALDANSALAHASLGVTLVQQNKFAEAKPHFEKAVQLDSKNYLPYFYYAYALSREDMDASGYVRQYLPDKAAKMTNLLTKAIELNPSFPESYRLQAFINTVNGYDLDEGIDLLKKALALEPGNQQYALEMAQIHLRKEEFEPARTLAQKVFASAEDAAVRERAQLLVANINRYEAELKRIQQIQEDPEAPEPTPTPQLSEEELINQALNEALRRPRAGEKRVVGHLVGINCENQLVTFSVRPINQTTAQTFKFVTTDLSKLILIAFTADANGQQLGCDTKNIERFVVVTFRPDKNQKVDGEIIAFEFMPKNFKFIQ